jgi:hypothetical protein
VSDEDTDGPIDVVATVGPLDVTVAALREFLHRSGAIRVAAIVDLAPGEGPALIDVARLEPTEVAMGGQVVHMPHAIELDVEVPELPDVKQLPPFEVRPEEGEVAGPLGGMEHYGRAVRGLAELLGGRNVAMVQFETNDPDAPLGITARTGDPVVISIGEDEYEMEPGWPDAGPPPQPPDAVA